MINSRVRWGPMVAGILTIVVTLAVLSVVELGAAPVGFEGYGFGIVFLGICLFAWIFSRILLEHYERVIDHLPRLLRFGFVGLLTTFIDLGILNLLLFIFASNTTYARDFPFFATISFIAATLNSYLWNRHWTFKEHTGTAKSTLPRFYLVTIVSFLVNVGISSLLVWFNPFPFIALTLWANISKLAATGISLMLNFLGYQNLVFKDR